ncbi:MBL fold metallo-hydrolase [Peribacillus simplex]|uniref:MBL fold metallo-hydrolase n=2 Tax=Peribacillus simplex TaxID=1478 RepID=A0A8B5XV00_9BACI|nr:MBL fold metallo-hydrolase [Peribacillus simplex]MEC1400172.1 MBL fold metallo-hydrolase [Peribacillus simplex]MED3912430.1 MBL fold metallo-hydrolase [Peribacillus simplex]MED3987066.1 MBL fold metallo-hydrolase [Peribacillus simplex]MED4094338.1 MBL fold metallo-hydrolase [Peribacillus simplex]TVX78466.1 MBL fold metallo-hydrolase [Peribacillus simplex]
MITISEPSGNYQQITDYLIRIGIPVPFPMKHVYCYLFRMKEEIVLVDVGFPTEVAKKYWEKVLQELSINPTDISKIILTHFHPDHTGLIDWMQQRTGARVYMSNVEAKMIRTVFGGNTKQAEATYDLFGKHAVPEPLLTKVKENVMFLSNKVNPLPKIEDFEDTYLETPGGRWSVKTYSGHAEGHLCFYQETQKIMLIGDVVLNKITPNISLWPNSDQNPLKSYFSTLDQLVEKDVSIAYPAHGTPIENLAQRAKEIIEHHNERLAIILTILESKKVAYDITEKLFQHKKLTDHQWRFAIAETLAHLEYLVEQKRIQKISDGRMFRYEL